MNTEKKVNGRERVYLLNVIAEQNAAHEAELAEKDRLIDHYKRQYEIAVRRKLKERHDRTERRKERVCGAVYAKTKRGECRKNGEEKEGKEHIWNASNSITAITAATYRSWARDCVRNAMTRQYEIYRKQTKKSNGTNTHGGKDDEQKRRTFLHGRYRPTLSRLPDMQDGLRFGDMHR